MKTAQEIVNDFNTGVTTDSVTKRELIDHLSDHIKLVDQLLIKSIEQNELIINIKEIGRNWKHLADIRLRAFERLEGVLKTLPDKILQIDSWADTEELNFPIPNATEDEQNEWFFKFIDMQATYVKACFEEALDNSRGGEAGGSSRNSEEGI
jgi:hypothetical protein